MDPQQISFDMVRQKLKDIVMTRGKRGVDRNEQVEMLTYLASVAKGPVQKIEVLIQVVSALFDINPSMSTHMSVPLWKRCAGTLLEVLQTLADNDHIEVDEAYDNPEERTEEPPSGQPAKVCMTCGVSQRMGLSNVLHHCCRRTWRNSCFEHTHQGQHPVTDQTIQPSILPLVRPCLCFLGGISSNMLTSPHFVCVWAVAGT